MQVNEYELAAVANDHLNVALNGLTASITERQKKRRQPSVSVFDKIRTFQTRLVKTSNESEQTIESAEQEML
jgi:hypothetical protein